MPPTPFRARILHHPALAHGFFGRSGGVSAGPYASLNTALGSGDRREHILANRARVAEALHLPPERLVTLKQIHSPTCHTVDLLSAIPNIHMREGDALATRIPGVALGVLSADCAPILLADTQAGVIGAAHAGWKGALTGVIEATLEAMERLGASASRIVAAIGPCIHQPSYEVDAAFRQRFLDRSPQSHTHFIPSPAPGHFLFDLPSYAATRLTAIARTEILMHDTYAQETAFFSYRRATHRKEPDYGRQIAAIALTGE